MPILIVTQSLLLPLVFSAIILYFSSSKRRTQAFLVLFSWASIYFWTKGALNLIPGEALDWIWVLIAVNAIFILSAPQQLLPLLCSLLFGVFLFIFSWPILSYQNELTVWFELVFFETVVAIVFYKIKSKPYGLPAIHFATSALALAIVSILSGSLLIGQLALSLVALTGIFSFYEIIQTPTKHSLYKSTQLMLLSLYFSLVIIGRLYVEIPMGSTVLLVLAPLSSLLSNINKNYLIQIAFSSLAILWALL